MSTRQRPHKPDELGPRLYRNHNGDICIDLRPWGGGRKTVRDPESSPHWPRRGRKPETLKEAARWKWDYVGHVEGKAAAPTARFRTLKEATTAFLKHREASDPYNTFKTIQTGVRHLVDFLGPSFVVEKATPEALQEWVDDRVEEGYKPHTLSTYLRGFSVFFQWVGMPEATEGIRVPSPSTEGVRTWTEREIARLREAAGTRRLLVELLLGTGARESEAYALTWEDFDPVERIVHIRRQVAPTNPERTVPTKSKKNRIALVHPEFWRWYQGDAEGRVLAPIPRATRRYRLNAVLDAADLKERGVLAHVFRHTYSKRFLASGGSLEALQVFLGHSSITTTQEYYGHFAAPAAVRIGRMALYGEVAQEPAQDPENAPTGSDGAYILSR